MSGPNFKDRSGEVVAHYRFDKLIGSGGQSAVFRATDLRDGDQVAVKVLHEDMSRDPEFRERMLREAQAMALLSGTAAVRALDQAWTADGCLCLVMELLHGKDLEELLHDIESAGRLVPAAPLVELLDPIARTLQMAHDHGIVHRDLKPPNIFCISPEYGNGVRLLDFGFAKFTRAPSFTAMGMVAGSPSYLAPETWKGQKIDHRVDIYALGAITFRALGGRPAFPATDILTLLRQVTEAPRPSLAALRPDLPPAIDDWVAQALAIDPDDRFIKVGGMWMALRSILGL